MASQLVYVLTSLQSKESIIREVNSLYYDFLWDGKSDKIKRKVMINDFKDGGLRMLDIESFNKALKCSWTFFYSDWSRSGINLVRDLLKDDNSFLSYQEFKAKFKFTPCPLTYCGVICMLKIVKKSLGDRKSVV